MAILQLTARWIAALAAVFVGLKIWLAIGANSLWIDEFYSMGLAYMPVHAPTRGPYVLPIGVLRWSVLLSTDVDPHFPTIYAITRLISDAIHFNGLSLEYFVRAPLVLTLIGVAGLLIWICLAGRQDAEAPLLVSIILLCLVLDAAWREHSAEARMYGLMSVTGIAMLCAISHGRLVLASWLGLALALLHPFGAMFGFAPAIVTLLAFRQGLSRGVGLGILAGLTVAAVLVSLWMLLKFILKSSSGFTAGGGSDDIFRVLSALNVYAVGGAFLLSAACVVAFRKGGGLDYRTALIFLALLLSALAFLGLLILLKPSTPPYARYVRWANPVLFVMAAMGAIMLARHAAPKSFGIAALPMTLLASVAAVAVARAEPFGPPWGNALREAALYANAVADDSSIVTHDSFEIFDLPPAFRTGFRCFRAGQSVAYLSPTVRERMPCQIGNDVAIPAEVRQVYLIREPIAWVGPRRIDLDAFDRIATVPFGSASVDVYRRRAE
ncbi:hypothetical protein KPL78_20575 [Roseomonas sp. HJA6]|uniref:Glycosyltransferase RgtA/B/C/D-like domain-containing protein n=1 Tax=Roseomonas alba TaxID=2846776 RepID=A0ABS7ADL8_9PROT|nr:hypothetical protein [Neoroseomonas alba]MBW6400268.1 hypothetical protein [Neoroseomonas alba]